MLPARRSSDRGAGVPLRELALVGLTAAIITYFATGWVRVLATRLGAVAYPRERDVHLQPTPRMGGLAMYVGVVAGRLAGVATAGTHAWVRLLVAACPPSSSPADSSWPSV